MMKKQKYFQQLQTSVPYNSDQKGANSCEIETEKGKQRKRHN